MNPFQKTDESMNPYDSTMNPIQKTDESMNPSYLMKMENLSSFPLIITDSWIHLVLYKFAHACEYARCGHRCMHHD